VPTTAATLLLVLTIAVLAGTASAAVRTARGAQADGDVAVLPCVSPTTFPNTPPSGPRPLAGSRTVFGVSFTFGGVLPRPGAADAAEPHLRFSKRGLTVRRGTVATMTMLDDEAQMSWGGAPRATTLSIGPCADADGDQWRAYTGGLYVPRVGCYRIRIESGGSSKVESVGVGRPCGRR